MTSARVDFLAVRPHPDDESSATGGLLARYAAAGLRTAVVTCTGGEEGEIVDPTLDHAETFPRLRELREAELRAACAVLGVAELHLLGYRDSGMAGTPANEHPEAFTNVDLDEAGARLAELLRVLRPRVVVTENEHGTYGHPDHVRCHQVTVHAWQLAADPAAPLAGHPWQPARLYAITPVLDGWDDILALMRQEGLDTAELEAIMARRRERVPRTPDHAITAAIDVSDYAEIQRQALLCHRTQINPGSFFMGLPPKIRRRAFATAYLTRLQPAPVNGERDSDLFAGG